MELHRSLNTILGALDTHTCVLMIEYFSAPIRVSLTALYFMGFVNVACFYIFKNFLNLHPLCLGTGLGNPWDMYRFPGGSRLRH